MTVLAAAIKELKFRIPPQIIEATFKVSDFSRFNTGVSVDEQIRLNVIERVMYRCNLYGGTQVEIPLFDCETEFLDVYNTIIKIPFTKTNGRKIVMPLNVRTWYTTGNTSLPFMPYNSYNNSTLLDAAKGVMNSHLPTPAISTSSVSLVGPNIINVNGNGYQFNNTVLTCYLEHEEDFSNIKAPSFSYFFKLAELAAKSFIYNTMIVKMDKSALYAGYELGRLQSIVESYQDAEQMFEDYLENTWVRVARLNDHQAKRMHLAFISGGSW